MLAFNQLKKMALVLAPFIGAGFLIGSFPGYKMYEFVWKDDRFCFACHMHNYANVSWKRSVHGKLTTCHDCHHQPLRQYIIEAFVMVTHKPSFPEELKHTPNIPRDLCFACHTRGHDKTTLAGPLEGKNVDSLPKVEELYLHRLHLEKKVTVPLPSSFHLEEQNEFGKDNERQKTGSAPERLITCIDCHGGPANRGHNFSAIDQSCTRCHVKHKGSPIQDLGCRNCHFQDFLVPVKGKPLSSEHEGGHHK